MQKIILVIACLLSVLWNVQAQIVITDFDPPDNTQPDLVICGMPASFTIEIVGNEAESIVLDLDMAFNGMSGVEYIPGSFMPQISEDATDLANPIITIGDLNGTQTYSFDVTVNCDLKDYLENGGLAIFDFDFAYQDTAGMPLTYSFQNSSSNGFQEFNNSVKIPNIAILGGVNTGYVANDLGEIYTREIRVEQSGLVSSLEEIKIRIAYGPGLIVGNQQVNGIPINPANFVLISSGATGEVYELTLTTSDFATYNVGDSDNLFESPTTNPADNEFFIWSEDVTIASCEPRNSTFEANWGCDGRDCNTTFTQFDAALSTLPPDIAITRQTRTYPTCFDEPTVHTYTVENTGAGYATNLLFRIRTEHESNTALDAGSMTYQIGTGAIQNFDATSITNPANLPASNCYAGTTNYYDRVDTEIIGSLAPGEILTLTFNTYQCCREGCGVNGRYFGSSVEARFNLLCASATIIRSSAFNTVDVRSLGAATVPASMNVGDTEAFIFNLMTFDGDLNQINAQGEYCMSIDIPANLQFDPANTLEWVGSDGTTVLSPSSVSPTGVVDGPVTMDVCFSNGFGTSTNLFRNSNITIDLTYPTCVCGVNVNTSMELLFRYGPSCADPCELKLFCRDGLTFLAPGGCCGTGCDGLVTTNYSIERTCYGLPDNDQDGCPDAAGALDFSRIRMDRAMQGDEMRFTANGEIRLNTGTIDSLEYLYFETAFSGGSNRSINPIGNNSLTITDASTGMTYTCTGIASINDANTISFDISVQEIRGCGTVPLDFIYEANDLLEISGDVVNTENIGCDIDNVEYINCFYGALTPAPVAAGDRLKCNVPRIGGFTAVGYSINDRNGTRRFTGCGYENELYSEFCIGGGAEGTDPFPYEYREWSFITESKIAMPSGYLFNTATYRMRRTNRTQSITDRTITRSDLVQLVNDTFMNDFANIFATCGTAPNLSFSDDGNEIRSEFIFDVPCTAELNVDKEAYHEITRTIEFCSPFVQPQTYTNGFTHTFTPTGPELKLQTGNDFSEPDGTFASWELFLDNGGNGANNTFLVILDAPNITVEALNFADGSTVPETNGIYQLGDLALGGSIPFRFDFTYASCFRDSIQVVAGFDCLGYPADRLEILSGGWPCDLDTLTLYAGPLPGKIKQDLIQSPSMVMPCDVLTYELQVANIDRAILYEPEVSVFLPYSSGMEFIPGTEEACYPCDAGAPIFNFPIFTPTEIIVTTLGIEYVWDLETLIAQINMDGFPGLEDSNVLERVLRIQFDVKTNCNFVVGDFPRFRSNATTACGAETRSVIQSGDIVMIEGTGAAYRSLIDVAILDPADGAINACNGMATIGTSVQFTSRTDGLDSMMLVLPAGMTYVPGSIFFTDATQVYSTTPTLNVVNGIQEVKFGIRDNIPAFTPIDFVLDVITGADTIPCRALEQPILGRTYIPNTVSCDGMACDLSVLTGSTEEVATFEKYQYEIIDYELLAPCGSDQLAVAITVQNSGIYPIIDPTTIDLFYDADESGTKTTGDIAVGTLTATATIPVAGNIILSENISIDPTQSCPLLAEITGCTCVEPIPLEEIRRMNAGNDFMICNTVPINLGCGENIPSFSYFWSGLNGAPISALADRTNPTTSFTYTNTNTIADTLAYVLATTVGACVSFDTVEVIVLPTLTDIAPNAAICPGESVILSGPLGFTNYQWLPTVDLSDPTIPRPTINTLTTPSTIYTLSYTNADGCLQNYQQTVDLGFNCTDVELDKTVDLTLANVGDILTYSLVLVNQGPLPASGVQVTDQLPSSLQYLSHTPSAATYNATTGVWDIGVVLVGDTFKIDILASVLSVGLINNVAEVSAMDNTDIDSTPNNGDPNEDDYGETCTTVPTIIVCDFEVPVLFAPSADTYQWYVDGVAIAGATSATFQPDPFAVDAYFGTHTFSLYPDGSCGYIVQIDRCTADLSLTKTASPDTAILGDVITYTLTVNNDGPAEATNIDIEELLPAGLNYSTYTATDGVYDPISSVWTIANLPINDSETLEIEAILTTGGIQIDNITEIVAVDQPDIDSTPDNDDGDQSEDDEDNASIFSAYVADIGNYVWNDIDQDGQQELNESPMPNVVVTLYNATTNLPIGTELTDMDGEYYFRNIPKGDYYLTFDLASNPAYTDFEVTLMNNYIDSGDSDISTLGRTSTFAFDPFFGDNFSIDAGFHLECAPPSVDVFGN